MVKRILWGTRQGAPDWDEELITEQADRIPEAMNWAQENGFDRFRIAIIDLDAPIDFSETLNV
jgi:hypothetical protein